MRQSVDPIMETGGSQLFKSEYKRDYPSQRATQYDEWREVDKYRELLHERDKQMEK